MPLIRLTFGTPALRSEVQCSGAARRLPLTHATAAFGSFRPRSPSPCRRRAPLAPPSEPRGPCAGLRSLGHPTASHARGLRGLRGERHLRPCRHRHRHDADRPQVGRRRPVKQGGRQADSFSVVSEVVMRRSPPYRIPIRQVDRPVGRNREKALSTLST